jgi:hypothetical protein
MSMTQPISERRSFALPSARTLVHLFLGGCAATGFYEAFAAVPTAWVAGWPLQPPELVKSLFEHQLGVQISLTTAQALHYLTGLVGYPVGYYVLTRWVKSFGHPIDGWVWGVITYFIALGFWAPLAGQPFLLWNVPLLSFMSLVGHAIFGYLLAVVFERFEKS